MNVEFTTIREIGFLSFQKKCGELWKDGWRPLFPHKKRDGTAERFWSFYNTYTQQWTRTTNHKSDES
jgi:hypothetical protein